jgi:hypothetical protein
MLLRLYNSFKWAFARAFRPDGPLLVQSSDAHSAPRAPFFGFWGGYRQKTPGQPCPSAPARHRRVGRPLCPKRRVSRFFCALRCPRFNRRTPARGRGPGSLECTWRRSARCWKPRRTRKRGQASPDDGDALALTFAQPVEPAEVEEEDEEEEFGGYGGHSNSGWMR